MTRLILMEVSNCYECPFWNNEGGGGCYYGEDKDSYEEPPLRNGTLNWEEGDNIKNEVWPECPLPKIRETS